MITNLFNVFDFSFVYWIAFGGVCVPIVLWVSKLMASAGILMTWWKWLLMGAFYVVTLLGIAAPFTLMGEREVSAGLRLLAFDAALILLGAAVVYRVLIIGRRTPQS